LAPGTQRPTSWRHAAAHRAVCKRCNASLDLNATRGIIIERKAAGLWMQQAMSLIIYVRYFFQLYDQFLTTAAQFLIEKLTQAASSTHIRLYELGIREGAP
jgi:hypothetical protein